MCVRFPCVVVTAILSGIVPASGFVASFHTLPELKDRKPKLASDEVDDVDTMLKENFDMIDEADIVSHHALHRRVYTAIPTRFQEVCGAYTLSKLECQRMISYVDGNLASGKHHKVKTIEVPFAQVVAENHLVAGVNGEHYDGLKDIKDKYITDFVTTLDPEIGSRFLVAFGERWTFEEAGPCFPVLQKVRWVDPSLRPMGNNVLLPLKYHRHFEPVFKYQHFDIPYDQKENKIIFRGSPNEGECGERADNCSERANLVHGYYNSSDPRIDVGLIEGPSSRSCDPSTIKGYMSFEEQLRAKFLIASAGNDKASSLNWMLHSNSVVFMVPPSVESWLLESWLKPWKHYIPLQFDFSDLPQKLDWAIAHPEECIRIAQEGKRHVNMFVDKERDSLVRSAVLKWYSLHVDIEFVDGDAPHDDLDSCTAGTPPNRCNAVPSIHSNAV
eukprot:TRINITY_DN674_c0_g1_i2.p1 TRINITY_DN674_c0_g1~~TRINITY_DN674_c0_g1_i2.p1  ORF type:complete len:443 (-),score=36.79 TRINITY_DN674_c0_g1_i2:112-1440(-)